MRMSFRRKDKMAEEKNKTNQPNLRVYGVGEIPVQVAPAVINTKENVALTTEAVLAEIMNDLKEIRKALGL
jgi:hypothetical protein